MVHEFPHEPLVHEPGVYRLIEVSVLHMPYHTIHNFIFKVYVDSKGPDQPAHLCYLTIAIF